MYTYVCAYRSQANIIWCKDIAFSLMIHPDYKLREKQGEEEILTKELYILE